MSFNILNVGEHALNDNSIISCEHYSHPPYANTTFNKSDEIRIPIQMQEIYTLPTNSTLYFEGRLVNQEGKNRTIVHATSGYFSVNVPLKNLLGCFEDFKKILINIRQELVLIRSTTDFNSIITTNAQEKSNIELTKVLWRMPHVQVADVEKLRLLKYIEKGRDLEIAFRSWELHEFPHYFNKQQNIHGT
nr:unnamed protein product [Callosobruchus chinensis]